MNRYISFSGGVESTTMCVLWGGCAKAIFCDTGWEHEALYRQIDKSENKIREIHPNFKVIRLKPSVKINKTTIDNIPDYIKASRMYPSPLARYCTRMFKIKPIDNFLQDAGECEIMIGLNADEKSRIGNHGNKRNIRYSYPLIKNGITRDACIKILKKTGILPNYPVYMQRGGCVGCFFKSKKEFKAMAVLNEQEFDSVMEIEEDLNNNLTTREGYYRIKQDMPKLKELKAEANATLFKPEEMYLQEEIYTPCGVFCHR